METDLVHFAVGNGFFYVMLLNFRLRKLVCGVADRPTDRQTVCLGPESQRVAGPVRGY